MKDRIYYNDNNRGFTSLIGLLLAIAIIMFLCYYVMNNYDNTSSTDNETKEALEESGIDTSSYSRVLESSKKKIEDINKKTEERNKEYQK